MMQRVTTLPRRRRPSAAPGRARFIRCSHEVQLTLAAPSWRFSPPPPQRIRGGGLRWPERTPPAGYGSASFRSGRVRACRRAADRAHLWGGGRSRRAGHSSGVRWTVRAAVIARRPMPTRGWRAGAFADVTGTDGAKIGRRLAGMGQAPGGGPMGFLSLITSRSSMDGAIVDEQADADHQG